MAIPQIARSLFKSPLVTAACVLALGLALGATTLVYSVVDGVLLKTLPYRDPDRVVVIWETNPQRGRFENVASPANFLSWKDTARSFSGIAAVTLTFPTTLGQPGSPEEVPMQVVSGRLFEILGVNARLGRTFTPEEDSPGGDAALISHRLWQRRFGGDPNMAGRRVHIDGRPRTVVGVMPAGFSVLDPSFDLWMPMGFDDRARNAGGRYLIVVGRLAPGISAAQAQSEMTQISATLAAKFPDRDAGWGSRVVAVHGQVTGKIRPALLMLLGAVGLVLLIACVNVANLLLARGVSRRREIAVRTSLGASRARIIGSLLAESALIALGGALVGAGLALAGLRALQAQDTGTDAIPRLEGVTLDWRVGAVALAVATVAALVAGLLPAVESTRFNLTQSLHESSRMATSGRATRLRSGLVIAEVALAVILIAGSGLLIRSLIKLLEVDPGFRPAGVLTARVSLSGERYESRQAQAQFFEQLSERLSALPAVTSVGVINFLPVTGVGAGTGFTVAGRPVPVPGQEPVTEVRIIGGNYFGALGIPVRRGRIFDSSDAKENARVLIVNESLAKAIFPNEDPIGRELLVQWNDPAPQRIVGVVGDVRHESIEVAARPTVYFPHRQSEWGVMYVVLHTTGDPGSLGPALVNEVRRMDGSLPVSAVQPMDAVIAEGVATRRLVMTLLTAFAGVALVLAGLGIYAVMAYSVAERRAELAIRMALGADGRRVLRLVLGQSALTTAIGLGIGLVGAIAGTRLMTELLYDVAPGDPVTLAVAMATLALVALGASWLPGRAAAAVDPLQAMRTD